MEKVKITRELADAIEEVIKHADENILYDVTYIKNVCEGYKFDEPKLRLMYNYIQKVGFKEYFKALIVGYEVEETPEDKVREYYHGVADYDPPRTAIKRVLNLLNIKIVGVNHE